MVFKEFKNFNDQIKLLESRGLVISNRVRLTDYLKKYNYERIFKDYHSYFLHINNPKENIIKYRYDITSDDILNFFDFEQSLSKTLIWTILEFEKKFSTLVAYYTTKHAITYARTEEEANKLKKVIYLMQKNISY